VKRFLEDVDDEDEVSKRRKILEDSKELDQESELDEDDERYVVLNGWWTNFSDDSESEDEDDTAALYAELQKIKTERAAEKAKQEAEVAAKDQEERDRTLATGNPLLNSGPKDFNVKRRWDEDVIFKNQARGVDEKPKNRFINDMLRSDFHKKFLNKYVK
jgi:protein CWC15